MLTQSLIPLMRLTITLLPREGMLISNKKAARIGDPTAHGGVIVAGEPTVIIGDSAQAGVMRAASQSGAPFCEECARARARAAQPKAALVAAPAPSPPPSPPDTSPERREAERLLRAASAAEPHITHTLQGLAARYGGRMEGLGSALGAEDDFRLKSAGSLARKIKSDRADDALHRSARDVADDIGDALRYTTILDGDRFSEGVNQSLATLEAQGYTVLKVKNSWLTDRNHPKYEGYRGVNTNVRSPEGQVFELQFHTRQSFDMKQTVNHPHYEVSRDKNRPAPERSAAVETMRRNADTLVPPRDVATVRNRP